MKGAPYHPLRYPYLTASPTATILVFVNAMPTSLSAMPKERIA